MTDIVRVSSERCAEKWSRPAGRSSSGSKLGWRRCSRNSTNCRSKLRFHGARGCTKAYAHLLGRLLGLWETARAGYAHGAVAARTAMRPVLPAMTHRAAGVRRRAVAPTVTTTRTAEITQNGTNGDTEAGIETGAVALAGPGRSRGTGIARVALGRVAPLIEGAALQNHGCKGVEESMDRAHCGELAVVVCQQELVYIHIANCWD